MAAAKLSAEDIKEKAKEIKDWKVDGDKLERRFKFDDFAKALAFVNDAGDIAEEMDHHPDIKLGYGYAEFEITTHSEGGVTQKDFDLASKIDKLK